MITESPPKAKRAPAKSALRNLQLDHNAPHFYDAQLQWHREAARLRELYERTGAMRHFRALSRHLRGMRERGIAL